MVSDELPAYGNAVVVTATFKGEDRFERADKLERLAKKLGAGIFMEQVEVEDERR
jgi:hypothetical protein